METYTQEQVAKIIEDMHKRDMEILDDYRKEMSEVTNKLISKTASQSITFGTISGALIGVIIGNLL